MAVFQGEGLACVRGGRLVFKALDFALEGGELLLLVGPNGSGKSSLLRLLCGLIRPAAGRLSWNGEPVEDDLDGHRGRVRYAGHMDAVKPILTAAGNLEQWARLHGLSRAKTAARVDAVLLATGLSHLADVPGYMLSAGQKRRINLGRSMLAPGPLWLLDEPTVGLDTASLEAFRTIIATRRADGVIVALATHGPLAVPGAIPDAGRLDLGAFTPTPEESILWGTA